jgi:hypothetical protein
MFVSALWWYACLWLCMLHCGGVHDWEYVVGIRKMLAVLVSQVRLRTA